MRIAVTYFDLATQRNQTETFGMLHCARAFALALAKNARFRVLEVLDVWTKQEIELDS